MNLTRVLRTIETHKATRPPDSTNDRPACSCFSFATVTDSAVVPARRARWRRRTCQSHAPNSALSFRARPLANFSGAGDDGHLETTRRREQSPEQTGLRSQRREGQEAGLLWHSPACWGENRQASPLSWGRRPSLRLVASGFQIFAALRTPCGESAKRHEDAPASRAHIL